MNEYDTGYRQSLEWAISQLDLGLNVDEVRRLLRAKVSEISERERARMRGLAEDRARLRADADTILEFKKKMMTGSPNP
jgi:DNA-binding transcriptional MerR regulator